MLMETCYALHNFRLTETKPLPKSVKQIKKLKNIKNNNGRFFQYLDNIPEKVWNFHIGGYQICYK